MLNSWATRRPADVQGHDVLEVVTMNKACRMCPGGSNGRVYTKWTLKDQRFLEVNWYYPPH